jgi:hypothetical protein
VSSKKPSRLLVVAHPDDETLFFAGLLQSKTDWCVVCVTDGNADGLGDQRQAEFRSACKLLKVKDARILNFSDAFERRLDVDGLQQALKNIGTYKEVFTHSVIGEYGHPHHQDVCFAVHKAFLPSTPVFSIAYNTFPTKKIALNPKQYALKTKILSQIYFGEMKRLIHLLPAHAQESFCQISLAEAETLYATLRDKLPLNTKVVKAYKWLVPYVEQGGGVLQARVF